MYASILVPLDGSKIAEQVLPYVRLLATRCEIPVRLLQAIESPPAGVIDSAHGIYPHTVAESMLSHAGDYLEEVASSLRGEGLTVSSEAREGDPVRCIVREGRRDPGTLIAMTTHGRSGITRWVMGSVTDKVLHGTNNPLLVVRSREPEATATEALLQDIVVPLDESTLAEQALPHAVQLARSLGAGITLLRVTPSAADYYTFVDYPPADYGDLSEEVDAAAGQYLQRTAAALKQKGVAQVEEKLLHGNPALAIIDWARDTPNNLVLMTTHGRTGPGRWVLGSVADRVVRHSGDPVLIIREPREPED